LFPDAEVWMHVHDGSLVNARDQDFSAGRYFQGAFFPHVNRYYVESEPLPLRPFNLRLLFSPGHTQGSVCFFEPEKRLLFSGDTLFADAVGRWDLPSGSLVDLQASLRKIRALDFDALLPGHGPLLREPRERQKQAIDERLAELG